MDRWRGLFTIESPPHPVTLAPVDNNRLAGAQTKTIYNNGWPEFSPVRSVFCALSEFRYIISSNLPCPRTCNSQVLIQIYITSRHAWHRPPVEFSRTAFYIMMKREWIFVARATCSPFFCKIWKWNFKVSKKSEKKSRCRQWWDLPICKFWTRYTSYSGLQKNEKIWQILRFWNLTLFTNINIRICHFCTAPNIRYFQSKFSTFVDHSIIYM